MDAVDVVVGVLVALVVAGPGQVLVPHLALVEAVAGTTCTAAADVVTLDHVVILVVGNVVAPLIIQAALTFTGKA